MKAAGLAVLATGLAVSACGPVGVPITSPDGDYRGSATRFQVLRRTCQRPGLMTVNVKGGVMYYRWEGQYLPVSVSTSGTVSGGGAGARVTGTYDGTTIQGDATDGQCGLHFTLKRITG